jgi:uncharacterized MAPEG superfamily protein
VTLKVVDLKRNEDPREVIDGLEDLLQRAKAGEIESYVAVIIRASDGAFMTRGSGHKNKLAMAGALAFAMHDFITGGRTE